MSRWRIHFCLIGLLTTLGVAQGQTLRLPVEPDSVSSATVVLNAGAPADTSQLSFSQQATSAMENDAFRVQRNAAPPAEPEVPAWGNYLQPEEVPVALPPLQYDLVGPPRGITQQIQGQTYQRTVSDPNTLLADDIRMDKALNLARPDGLAPVGVFNDHMLPVGAMLVSYRYLSDGYDGIYVGSHRVSAASLNTIYPAVPTNMLSTQQVALIEYGVTQDLTMTALLPFGFNNMHFSDPSTGNFNAAYNNPGDIRINALLALTRSGRHQSHMNVGVNIPAGMLFTLTQDPSTLPYAVRNTSGTYDLLLGYTYRYQAERWSAGAQINGIPRMGSNFFGYRLGNELQTTAWIQRVWSKFLSTSARLDGHVVNNIAGMDVQLDPTFSPANQPGTQGYRQLNVLIGGTFFLPDGRFPGQRLSIEAGLPIYQSLDGPQLGLNWILNAGWNMIW